MLRILCPTLVLVLAIAGCRAPDGHEIDPAPAAQAAPDPCADLLAAAPADWPERIAAVRREGASATGHLIAGLGEDPGAPGAQAALAVLGAVGDPRAVPTLERWVQARELHAAEAALALGRLRASSSAGLLLATAADPRAEITLRTASACAMIELGRGAEVADLVEAVLLAGTPAGREAASRVDLPPSDRWALQRHMILIAARRAGLPAAFDTDSSWPRLAAGTETLLRALRGPPARPEDGR